MPASSTVPEPVIGAPPAVSLTVKLTVAPASACLPARLRPARTTNGDGGREGRRSPATMGLLGADTTVRVEAALTVSGTAVEVAPAVVAPVAKYSAVIEFVPSGRVFVM